MAKVGDLIQHIDGDLAYITQIHDDHFVIQRLGKAEKESYILNYLHNWRILNWKQKSVT